MALQIKFINFNASQKGRKAENECGTSDLRDWEKNSGMQPKKAE